MPGAGRALRSIATELSGMNRALWINVDWHAVEARFQRILAARRD
jgi:hypothetical protein